MTTKTADLLDTWASFFVSHALAIKQVESKLVGVSELSLDEYDVLLGISRAVGQQIRYSELASITVFTRSGITRLIKRLEDQGFVERRQCQEDRRGAYAVLTKLGKQALKDTWKLYSKAVIDLFDPCFSQAEAKDLKVLLEKIIDVSKAEPLVQIGLKKKI